MLNNMFHHFEYPENQRSARILDIFPMIVPASAVRVSDCHNAVTTDHGEWEYDNLRHVEMKVSQIFIFEMCLIIQFLLPGWI